jgi:hypothetical protein
MPDEAPGEQSEGSGAGNFSGQAVQLICKAGSVSWSSNSGGHEAE